MMCAERLWFVWIAIILGLIMGLAGSEMFAAAFIAQLALIVVFLVRGFTGKCPSLMLLSQIVPPCRKG
jgi:polyferredoxin